MVMAKSTVGSYYNQFVTKVILFPEVGGGRGEQTSPMGWRR